MAIKTIEYTVDIAGVTPAAEQFAGTQGDHRVAEITFTISDALYLAITSASESGKALYRFDIYDGEGGIWSSDAAKLSGNTVSIELEERHTRYGGKLTVYLVITALSEDGDTEIELYSFPVRLMLNNRPEGIYQDGENYESITSLAEIAKNNAQAAESSNHELQEFAAEIEEKLKNGDFDGVGVQSAEIVNDELIITYTDGTSQNLGNVKGDKGDKGDTGRTGDTGPQGIQGIQGERGVDGASVTIESISESTVDGGDNIIEFSDGKSITVKNGTKGSKGDTGATGASGKDGSDGVGIASVYIENGNLYVRKTNETLAQNLGRVKGDKGDTGNAIADGIVEAVADTIPLRDGNASINVNLGFMDVCDGLPVPMKKIDNGTSRNVIYWNGTKANKFYEDTDGASADNPIIINTAEELAYVASAKYEDTYGKYFKIADGIDKIVLQSETYYKDIIALDSAEAVRDYFKEIIDNQKAASTLLPWVSNTWNEANMCFGGNFDGNGVEIYGMYTSSICTANSGLTSNYAGGLFGIIDSVVITNVVIKNSYVNIGTNSTYNNANWQFGLLASYCKDCDTTKGDNVSYVNHCIVANNYVYKAVNYNSYDKSGVLLGGNLVGNYIIQNCLVYGNDATCWETSEYDLPIIGQTINSLIATDEFIAKHPDWVFNNGTNGLVETVLENSIVLGTPLNNASTYALNRVLSCNSLSNCLKNVYVDWDLDITHSNSQDQYYNYWFNKDYFLANSGATITESDIIGDKAVTNAPKLAWGVDWFVPTSYEGQSIPFDFHQLGMGTLSKLINNNTIAINNKIISSVDTLSKSINNNTAAINNKRITSVRTGSKYTFDWNAMYLIKSNSGNVDITLRNSATDAVVVDGDGNNLPASSLCLLILPKETIGTGGGYRICMFVGLTGTFSIVNPNVLKGLQFIVTSGNIYFTPPESATVFKLAF